MQVNEIVKLFGGRPAMSEILDLKSGRQQVEYWERTNKIPRWHIPAVKKAARKLGINIEEYLK